MIIQGNEGDQFTQLGDQVTRLYKVGQKMELPDGRLYRYALMGGTIGVANNLYQSPVVHADYLDEASTAALIQATVVMLSTTSQAEVANAFAEGYYCAEDASELGYFYPIASHNAIASATPGTVLAFLPEGTRLPVAIAGTKKINQLKSTWAEIIINKNAAVDSTMAGVPPSIIAASDWGWCQTKGVCSCLVEDVEVIGQEVRASETTAGCVTVNDYDEAADADWASIARVVEVAPTGDHGLIELFLE